MYVGNQQVIHFRGGFSISYCLHCKCKLQFLLFMRVGPSTYKSENGFLKIFGLPKITSNILSCHIMLDLTNEVE